jgi:hypothetical protein
LPEIHVAKRRIDITPEQAHDIVVFLERDPRPVLRRDALEPVRDQHCFPGAGPARDDCDLGLIDCAESAMQTGPHDATPRANRRGE